MKRKRIALLVALVILVAGAVLAVIYATQTNQPEPSETTSKFKDGDSIQIVGESICLQHAAKGDFHTMECAFGLKDSDGTDYALRDTTNDYSLVTKISSAKKLKVAGTYRTSTDTKYTQSGTIEVTDVEILE